MLETLTSYASLFNAALSLAILGVLVNLAKFAKEIERARSEVIEERLKRTEEDLGREQKWSERQKTDLREEIERLRVQLGEALTKSGFTIEALAGGASLAAHTGEVADTVERLRTSLEAVQDETSNPEAGLEIAKAHMAEGNWLEAAGRLDSYVVTNPDSFEVQFLRGVAWANSHKDDLSALRAYNDAVALAPADSKDPYAIRPLVYRGAMLKRLGRLREAQNDLLLALDRLKETPAAYEADNARYNLACVAALEGHKEAMMGYLRSMEGLDYRGPVRNHLSDYFARFSTDADLLAWLDEKCA